MFSNLLNRLFKKGIEGESLFGKKGWILEWKNGTYDVNKLFKIIRIILPPNSTLYLEGGDNDEVVSFLKSNSVIGTLKICIGTIWPKGNVFHVPGKRQVYKSLVDFSSRMASPEICDHFLAYKKKKVLLSAYDFGESPVYLSGDIPEVKVKKMALELGCSCKYVEKLA